MKLNILLITAMLCAPTLAAAGKIALADAERICAERAVLFSESIRGRDGDHPSHLMVGDRFRSCVHAKSGSYPRQKLRRNGRVLFDLNKILGL